MIKPRGQRRGAPSPPRPTIRIGPPRVVPASRGDNPAEDNDNDMDVADDETEPAEDVEAESSLTSNNGASTSRAMTQDTEGGGDEKKDQEGEDSQMVDVDGLAHES